MNNTLYVHLYAKKHTNFNEYYLEAMDYDDTFNVDVESSPRNH